MSEPVIPYFTNRGQPIPPTTPGPSSWSIGPVYPPWPLPPHQTWYQPPPQSMYCPPPSPWYPPMNYGPQINVAPEWLINSLTAPAGGGGAKTSKVAPKKGDDGEGKGGDSEETDKKSGPKGGAGGGDKKKQPAPVPLINCLSNTSFQSLFYDLRDEPETAFLRSSGAPNYPLPSSTRTMHITPPPTPLTSIKIISNLFPWSVDITNDHGITLDDLLHQMHAHFWMTVTEGEYWATTDEIRFRIQSAFYTNCAATMPPGGPKSVIGYGGAMAPIIGKMRNKDHGVLRIDWLLDHTILTGLDQDDAFAARRFPNLKDRSHIWVVTLASNATR